MNQLSTLNSKITLHSATKDWDLDKTDYVIIDWPTKTILLWRGREFKIAFAELDSYNGNTSFSFDDIVADIRKLTGTPTTYDYASAALEASHVIKSTPGYLNYLTVYNDSASGQYIMLFDSATLPANGAVPIFRFWLATKATGSLPLGDGLSFSQGIVVCNSSTGATKTIGSADCDFMASYI